MQQHATGWRSVKNIHYFSPPLHKKYTYTCSTSTCMWTTKFAFFSAKKRNIYFFWSCPRRIHPGLRGKLSFGKYLLLSFSSISSIWVDVFPKGNLPNLLRLHYVGSYNLDSNLFLCLGSIWSVLTSIKFLLFSFLAEGLGFLFVLLLYL